MSRAARHMKYAIGAVLLFAALFLFILPTDVIAGPMIEKQRMLYMRKYSLWGNITLQYDKRSDTLGNKDNTFSQNYSLNFQSYVITPKLLYYSINTGLGIDTGSMRDKTTTKTYGINAAFLPFMPFNFALRASRTEGDDYEVTSYGLSVSYSRRLMILPRRGVVSPEENINANLNANTNANNNANNNANKNKNTNANVNNNTNTNNNANANLNANANVNANNNANANLNANANVNANVNYNENANVNVIPKAKKRKIEFKRLYYYFNYSLPTSMFLNVDRYTYKSGNSESTWNYAALRTIGTLLGRTAYFLNFEYNTWTANNISHTLYGANLSTSTKVKWFFFQMFNNKINYRKNDAKEYGINSSLSGSRKKWTYFLHANYAYNSSIDFYPVYGLGLSASKGDSFLYKGVNMVYSFGIGYDASKNKLKTTNNLYTSGNLSASKQFSQKTFVFSSLGASVGTERSSFGFSAGVDYILRQRKAYVNGWDYSVRTGYIFDLSKTFGGDENNNRVRTSHAANLNALFYLGRVTISSDIGLRYSDSSESFSWNNSLQTILLDEINVVIGAGMAIDKPEGGYKTTHYNVYNLISYNISRNAFFSINTNYSKAMPANTSGLSINPSLRWFWRKLLVDLNAKYTKDTDGAGNSVGKNEIMIKVTRYFNFL